MQVLHGGPPGPIYALYGAREALLLPPLPLADDSAVHAFLDTCWPIVSAREAFRTALIAQGVFALPDAAGLRAQAADALKSGVLRVAPVPVSGLAPLKTEPAKAELSGKPFVMPPRINPPRTPPPPVPRHKVAIELAGQRADGLAGVLVVRSVADPKLFRTLSTHKQGTETHRLECTASALPDTPFDLYYDISMRGGPPMRILLAKALSPVDQDTQQARWPTVLVPVLPLRHVTPELNRAQARTLSGGAVVVFLNGDLHRELHVVNEQGALRDVPLGDPDGVGDARVARGHYTRQIHVPHLLNGVQQNVALVYSPGPLPWEKLMQLGGIAPDEARFSGAVKQHAANLPRDAALQKQLLQPIDLSSYGTGFDAQTGIIGPIATALRPGPEQRDLLSTWRNDGVPVVYLKDPDGTTRRLQVGICFDGSDNHKDRDRDRPDCDITNIAKLYDLYPNRRELNIRSIYVPGVGTVKGSNDTTLLGLALALGSEGGDARIALALAELERVLKGHSDIDEIVFDVFGFSRGAALARHFVNLIRAGLEELKHICAVRVRFVGLFDTVGSFYLPGNTNEGEFQLHLGPDSAEHVVHLTAHHEKRKNFPLRSLKDAQSNLPANFVERAFPGVHSDLGGGYQNPVANGGHAEIVPVKLWGPVGAGTTLLAAQGKAAGNDLKVHGALLVEVQRKLTRKELAILPLREMYRHAITHGVPLRPIPPDDVGYHLPLELDAKLFMWRNGGGTLEQSSHDLKDYIHTSHRTLPLSARDITNAPEPSGQRRVLPNQPEQAITPTPQHLKPPACAP